MTTSTLTRAMTEEQIAKALGFLPFDLWQCVATAENVKKLRGCLDLWENKAKATAMTRGTGRSTQILIAALSELSEGKNVVIAAYDPKWEDKMANQARSWAKKLGLNPDGIQTKRRQRRAPDTEDVALYVDHYLGPEGMGSFEVGRG